jgi:hypothetical protein
MSNDTGYSGYQFRHLLMLIRIILKSRVTGTEKMHPIIINYKPTVTTQLYGGPNELRRFTEPGWWLCR